MDKSYLHVTFNRAEAGASEAIERVFDKASDWIRYTPTSWLLWTAKDADEWYQRLKPILRDGEHVFIVQADLDNRAGWLPTSVWEWIKRDRRVKAS